MYKLKSIARRVPILVAALGMLGGVVILPFSAYADALNPLTDRSLTLSSSSPGWAYSDGSGNTTYAPPNSGANGQKTGETFSFNTSSDSDGTTGNPELEAFSFQFCTNPAGTCISPGNDDASTTPGSDDSSHADLNVVASSPSEVSSGEYTALSTNNSSTSQTVTGDDSVAYTYTGLPAVDNSDGNYAVILDGAYSPNWDMAVKNSEDSTGTGKNNYITLYNTSGAAISAKQNIKIVFYATNSNYITNPGAGAFFVKINDYKSVDNTTTPGTPILNPSDIVDGGVTVANVMNQSIEIETKVLETMQFSVGTVDPDTLNDTQLPIAGGPSTHTQCNPILTGIDASDPSQTDVLTMGDTTAENALSTAHTYSTHSFWRLSSNSSAGATVYYSGNTLANTEGDKIAAMTSAASPVPGSPQFGLALDNGTSGHNLVNFASENTPGSGANEGLFEQGADGDPTGVDASFTSDNSGKADVNQNQLYPLTPSATYENGTGALNKEYNGNVNPTTEFAFDPNSTAIPVELATENSQVVDCVTGKIRYIANIAATTPAGIYTTKINYIAAPQY